jgi:hypothetical protein
MFDFKLYKFCFNFSKDFSGSGFLATVGMAHVVNLRYFVCLDRLIQARHTKLFVSIASILEVVCQTFKASNGILERIAIFH